VISNKYDTLSIDKTLILSGIDIPNLNWNDYISKIYRDKSNLDQSSTSNVFLAQNPDNRVPLPKRHALDVQKTQRLQGIRCSFCNCRRPWATARKRAVKKNSSVIQIAIGQKSGI